MLNPVEFNQKVQNFENDLKTSVLAGATHYDSDTQFEDAVNSGECRHFIRVVKCKKFGHCITLVFTACPGEDIKYCSIGLINEDRCKVLSSNNSTPCRGMIGSYEPVENFTLANLKQFNGDYTEASGFIDHGIHAYATGKITEVNTGTKPRGTLPGQSMTVSFYNKQSKKKYDVTYRWVNNKEWERVEALSTIDLSTCKNSVRLELSSRNQRALRIVGQERKVFTDNFYKNIKDIDVEQKNTKERLYTEATEISFAEVKALMAEARKPVWYNQQLGEVQHRVGQNFHWRTHHCASFAWAMLAEVFQGSIHLQYGVEVCKLQSDFELQGLQVRRPLSHGTITDSRSLPPRIRILSKM